MPTLLQPFLFTTDPVLARDAVDAGVSGIVIDWECIGKRERQGEFDTQVNCDTIEDLQRVRAATRATVLCRINGPGHYTPEEVEQAISAGADEILLPMVRTPGEVQRLLDVVRGRCRVGILVETVQAFCHAETLAALPLSRVYVGLNDLAIERGTSLFAALVDGTVSRVRPLFQAPFGVAGLTLPERGHPIPCRLLMGEMARLDCHFTFLRRSFCRDFPAVGVDVALSRIREACTQAWGRTPTEVDRDHDDLRSAISAWNASAARGNASEPPGLDARAPHDARETTASSPCRPSDAANCLA